MAIWSARRTLNPVVRVRVPPWPLAGRFFVFPKLKSLVTLVNSQLVAGCFWDFNPLLLYLNYLFLILFEWSAYLFKLRVFSTIRKPLIFNITLKLSSLRKEYVPRDFQ